MEDILLRMRCSDQNDSDDAASDQSDASDELNILSEDTLARLQQQVTLNYLTKTLRLVSSGLRCKQACAGRSRIIGTLQTFALMTLDLCMR